MDHDVNRREGDFNTLYEAHYGAVRAYAWRRDAAFADDIVAETFLVAWKRLEDIPRDAALPWLLGVARNTHLNMMKGERRRRKRELTDALAWPREEGCAGDATQPENDACVLQLLKRLPQADREVLLLVAWEELGRADIARVLGCSRANVALRLYRARRRLQALLDAAEAAGATGPPVSASVSGQAAGAFDPHTRLLAGGTQHD